MCLIMYVFVIMFRSCYVLLFSLSCPTISHLVNFGVLLCPHIMCKFWTHSTSSQVMSEFCTSKPQWWDSCLLNLCLVPILRKTPFTRALCISRAHLPNSLLLTLALYAKPWWTLPSWAHCTLPLDSKVVSWPLQLWLALSLETPSLSLCSMQPLASSLYPFPPRPALCAQDCPPLLPCAVHTSRAQTFTSCPLNLRSAPKKASLLVLARYPIIINILHEKTRYNRWFWDWYCLAMSELNL